MAKTPRKFPLYYVQVKEEHRKEAVRFMQDIGKVFRPEDKQDKGYYFEIDWYYVKKRFQGTNIQGHLKDNLGCHIRDAGILYQFNFKTDDKELVRILKERGRIRKLGEGKYAIMTNPHRVGGSDDLIYLGDVILLLEREFEVKDVSLVYQ